jgi:signal peptidase I
MRARKAWVAVLLSVFFPGLGLLYSGAAIGALCCALLPSLAVGLAMLGGALLPRFLVPAVYGSMTLYAAVWVGQLVWAGALSRRLRLEYQPKPFNRLWVMLLFALGTGGCARAGLLLLRQLVVEPFLMPSTSMVPTVLLGEQFFVVKLGEASRVSRGDVIAFHPPDRDVVYVKRVIGLPGDRLVFDAVELSLNGEPVVEAPCATEQLEYVELDAADRVQHLHGDCVQETLPGGPSYRMMLTRGEGVAKHAPDVTVSPGHLYVLGDNRDNSLDSRNFGEISAASVLGRAVVIWFSWSSAEGFRWQRVGTRLSP